MDNLMSFQNSNKQTILLLAYEVETFVMSDLATRLTKQGKKVVILQCDTWSFTDNTNFESIHENKDYTLITLEPIFRSLGKSKIIKSIELNQWLEKIDLKDVFRSDPLLCDYRHNRNYRMNTDFNLKKEFIEKVIALFIVIQNEHNFDKVITFNNNYSTKNIAFQFFSNLEIEFLTILPTRVSNYYGAYLDFGKGGNLSEEKKFCSDTEAILIRDEFKHRIRNFNCSYSGHLEVLNFASQFLKKKLKDNISFIGYLISILRKRPKRFFEKIHLSPSLMQIFRHEVIVSTFKFFQWNFFKFDIDTIENKKFVFYPLQCTPESTILTFSSVVSEINFAMDLANNLPLDTYLVVKEHPAMIGIRDIKDYYKLKEIDNIILKHPLDDNDQFMLSCIHVITQCGTIGLEAAVLNKPCTCIGKTDFSTLEGVNCKLDNIDLINNYCNDGNESVDEFLKRVITHSIKLDSKAILYDPFKKNFNRKNWKLEVDKMYELIK